MDLPTDDQPPRGAGTPVYPGLGGLMTEGGRWTCGPCAQAYEVCDCAQFIGEPYYEDAYSDKLIQFLLKGAKPDKYAQRVVTTSNLRNLDWDALAATPGGH